MSKSEWFTIGCVAGYVVPVYFRIALKIFTNAWREYRK